jgi:hypothetical protein
MKHPYLTAFAAGLATLFLLRDGRREFRECAVIGLCVAYIVLEVLS